MAVGGVELYFSLGSLTGGGGATVAYRPSALFLDRSDTKNSKVLALSWDHDTASIARAVRVTYDPKFSQADSSHDLARQSPGGGAASVP